MAEQSSRNPIWIRDELILALELYLRNPASPAGKGSVEVAELSWLLNRLNEKLGRMAGEKFRNPNGVYMKMMNFRRFDPGYTSSGRVGLPRGNREEKTVWEEFSGDRVRLLEAAKAIRDAIAASEPLPADPETDEFTEAAEGRLLTRLHRKRERSRRLVEKRKEKALREHGRLCCEVCGFDFEERYGERGQGFIECHHVRPVHTLTDGDKTRLDDLALVCANCHRMIHAGRPWLTVPQLRSHLVLKN